VKLQVEKISDKVIITAMPKTAQFIVSGILVLYIVFATRPAPRVVSSLLASPIAQLAALAGVVYVGSSVSLLVAVLAALAIVLSIPAREYKDENEKIPDAVKKADKDAIQSLMKTMGKDIPAPPPAPLATGSKSEKKSEKKGASDKEPEAAADKMMSSDGGSGSEKFTLRDAAPF
jgi:hypothetical protein